MSERTKIMYSLPSFYCLIPREEKCGFMRIELSKQKWRAPRTHTHTHTHVCVFKFFILPIWNIH